MNNIIILGDSYSTFKGYIPNGYATYYPSLDVHELKETWWKQVVDSSGGNLLLNNSWSGSTIGYTGYNNTDCSKSSAFIYRFRKLKEEGFFENNRVDTVFVFGGTNDTWSNAPLGEMQFSGWEEKDLYFVQPAICHLMSALKTELPKTDIYFIINTQIKPEIIDCIKEAGKYYNVETIELKDIEKESGHPNVAGMKSISEQVLARLSRK
ncbi:MAG: hypothetical protein IJ514_01895 [Clostridia bacterium]|nr:hypothetical protein [Clostridia bacterium]